MWGLPLLHVLLWSLQLMQMAYILFESLPTSVSKIRELYEDRGAWHNRAEGGWFVSWTAWWSLLSTRNEGVVTSYPTFPHARAFPDGRSESVWCRPRPTVTMAAARPPPLASHHHHHGPIAVSLAAAPGSPVPRRYGYNTTFGFHLEHWVPLIVSLTRHPQVSRCCTNNYNTASWGCFDNH